METILEIRSNGKVLVAWDPNAEAEIAHAEIRQPETGDGYAPGEDPQAVAEALTELTQRVIDQYHWLHGE